MPTRNRRRGSVVASFLTTSTLVVGSLVGAGSLLGVGGVLTASTPAGASTPSTTSFSTPGSTSWTAPAGVTAVDVTIAGGAGGAGAAPSGGSGGAGSVIVDDNVPVTPGTSYPITVGAEGASYQDGLGGGLTEAFGEIAGGGGGGGAGGSNLSGGVGTTLFGGGGGSNGDGTAGESGTYGSGGGGGLLSGTAGYGGTASPYCPGGTAADGSAGSGGGGGAGAVTGGNGGSGGFYSSSACYTEAGSGGGAAGTSSLTVTGFNAGNGYVEIAPVVSAPSFTSSSTASFTAGSAGSFTITTSGSPTASLTESGSLPYGLTFTTRTGSNAGTATISGTPASNAYGTFPVVVTATNSQGSVNQDLDVVVTATLQANVAGSGTSTTSCPGGPGVSCVETTVSPGTLSLCSVPTSSSFPGVTLDGRQQTTLDALDVKVCDDTGTGAGWQLQATSTAFSDGAHDLAYAGGGSDATSAVEAPSLSCAAGSTCTLPTNSTSYPYVLPAASSAPEATTLLSAGAGTGLGEVAASIPWTLTVPATAYAGAYTSTWTISVVSGP